MVDPIKHEDVELQIIPENNINPDIMKSSVNIVKNISNNNTDKTIDSNDIHLENLDTPSERTIEPGILKAIHHIVKNVKQKNDETVDTIPLNNSSGDWPSEDLTTEQSPVSNLRQSKSNLILPNILQTVYNLVKNNREQFIAKDFNSDNEENFEGSTTTDDMTVEDEPVNPRILDISIRLIKNIGEQTHEETKINNLEPKPIDTSSQIPPQILNVVYNLIRSKDQPPEVPLEVTSQIKSEKSETQEIPDSILKIAQSITKQLVDYNQEPEQPKQETTTTDKSINPKFLNIAFNLLKGLPPKTSEPTVLLPTSEPKKTDIVEEEPIPVVKVELVDEPSEPPSKVDDFLLQQTTGDKAVSAPSSPPCIPNPSTPNKVLIGSQLQLDDNNKTRDQYCIEFDKDTNTVRQIRNVAT